MKHDPNLRAGIVLLAVLATLPWWLLTSNYTVGIAITALSFVALGLAWNIISGIGGQLSLGHSAYYGLGAYTSSLLLINLGISPWVGMLIGGAVAALFGLCLGFPSFRLTGVYFKLVTFVSALILEILVRHMGWLTQGDIGLNLPLLKHAPLMYQFGSPRYFFYIILVLAAAYFLATRWLLRNRFGYYLKALRDDQVSAEVLGIDSLKIKLMGFALSAFMTALVGTFYTQYTLFVDPAGGFGMFLSVKIALVAIVGGAGTLWGPVIGGLFLIPVAEWANAQFQSVTGVDVILYSLVLILVSIFLPSGLVTLPEKVRGWWQDIRRSSAPATVGGRQALVPTTPALAKEGPDDPAS